MKVYRVLVVILALTFVACAENEVISDTELVSELAVLTMTSTPDATIIVSLTPTETLTPTVLSSSTPTTTPTLSPTSTLSPTPTSTMTPEPTPMPDVPAYSPIERNFLTECSLGILQERIMDVSCDLPEGAVVYACVTGEVQFSGSEPWHQINLFYPEREDGFLIYRLQGDWRILVEQGAQVAQGTALAQAVLPVSNEQSSSFRLGHGLLMEIGFADVELPAEIVALW